MKARKKIKSKSLLARNECGENALHVAAEERVAVLEKLWAFLKESQLKEYELKNKLSLAKNKYICTYTDWNQALEKNQFRRIRGTMELGQRSGTKPDELLLAPVDIG